MGHVMFIGRHTVFFVVARALFFIWETKIAPGTNSNVKINIHLTVRSSENGPTGYRATNICSEI